LRVALCDDEAASRDEISALVKTFFLEREIELNLDSFVCAEDLLASPQEYDIVLMDIYLTGMSGMEAVERLTHSERCQVVFITTSLDHAVDAFRLNAAHYIVKPLTAPMVEDAITRCLTRLGQAISQELIVKTDQGAVAVPIKKITYIEVKDKFCTVHTAENAFQTYTSLDALFEQLDSSFLRAQRSYAVNMNFIKSFHFDRVVLRNGMEIMLSRNNRAELKKQYQRFLFNLARGEET